MNKLPPVAVIGAALAFAATARADVLAAWDFNGVNASATPVVTNSSSASGIDSNNTFILLGSGVTPSPAASTFGGSSLNDANLGVAVSSNDYLSWTVQALPGNTLTITNILWNFERTATGGSNLVLESSFDGFSTQLFGLTNFSAAAGGGDSSFAITSVSGSNSIEFRAYVWSASSGAGVDRFRNLAGNDLTVQGSITAIPEPASMILFGIGAAAAMWRRRRRA